jgi:hypothetical protein
MAAPVLAVRLVTQISIIMGSATAAQIAPDFKAIIGSVRARPEVRHLPIVQSSERD